MEEDRRSNRGRSQRNRNGQNARSERRSGLGRRSRANSSREHRGITREDMRNAYHEAMSHDTMHQGAPVDPYSRHDMYPETNMSYVENEMNRRPQEDNRRYSADVQAAHQTSYDSRGYQEPMSAVPAMAASDYSADRYKTRKTGMSSRKKIVIGVVIALVIVLVGGGIAAALWYNTIANNIKGDSDITNLAAPAADEPYYVLLMGSDAREGWETITADNEGDRADSIMVARVDEKEKKVSILSVPRDLRVKIPGHGYQKINSVVEYGGYDMLIDTLNDILGIKINYYAKIYFLGFLGLVDKLGGVTVEVPEGTASPEGEILPVGDAVKLNGAQALILARCRHGIPVDQGPYAMGDYQRTLNQRNLIKAIAKEVLVQDVTEMPGLITSLSENVETNMSVDRLLSLVINMKGMNVDSMQSSQLPIGSTTTESGEWQAVMYQDVYEVMDKNYINGLPLLENLGNFNPENNGNDIGGDFTDGKLYAYTMYSTHYGSPYTEGFTPSSSSTSTSSSSSSSSSKKSTSSSNTSSKP